MPTFEQARKMVLDSVAPLGVERVTLLDAPGRVLAEEVVAPWDMPLCDNSAMDGYAVRVDDCASTPVRLGVSGFIYAGEEPSGALEKGCAVKIMTGAPLPPGADAVVPVEETEEEGGRVTLLEPVKARQHVRFRAEDIAAGETAIAAGTLIRPAEVSVLASFARVMVPVFRRPRVAILSTGDELLEPGDPPVPGKVINSNAFSLAAAVREAGGDPLILGIARDNAGSHREKMREGLQADMLITSAGVSAGDRDLVREILADLGAEQLFWKVRMKPGGPTAFALHRGTPVFSLPGNPVSTMVTFEIFVRPALLKMAGRTRVIAPMVPVTLSEPLRKKAGKAQFIRLKLERRDGRWYGRSSGDQHTGILKTMLLADAMAVVEAERTEVAAGEEVQVYILRDDILLEMG